MRWRGQSLGLQVASSGLSGPGVYMVVTTVPREYALLVRTHVQYAGPQLLSHVEKSSQRKKYKIKAKLFIYLQLCYILKT